MPAPTCYRSHAAIHGSRMDRRRDPAVAVQRQRRLWLRLIVTNPGPILTIRAGAHDGVANVAAGVLKPNLMVLADCEPTSASRAF